MSFLWPQMLWALVALPALVLAYWWLLRRRKRTVVSLASIALLRQAVGPGQTWRRHVPPLLLLAALAALLLALARPVATLTLPLADRTILLAMDVSGSMRAEDVKPNRLVASQEAAKAFVAGLPREVRVGVVSFAGTAAVVQAPTSSRDDVLAAERKAAEFKPVPAGSYNSAAIILLTDGQRTTGPDPIDAAKMAADRGVRVYTVGMGTTQGEVIGFEGWSMRVRLDEATLKNISVLTQGEYFYAGSAEDLKKVYERLSSRMVVERKETEVTALLAALGALLVVAAAGLSLWWTGRVV